MLPDVVMMLYEHLQANWEKIDDSLAQHGMRLRNIFPYYMDVSFEVMPCLMLDNEDSRPDWHAIPMIGEFRFGIRMYGYVYHERPEVRRAAMVSFGVTTQILLNKMFSPYTYQNQHFWWEDMLCPILDFGVGFVGNSVVGAFTARMEVQTHVDLGS